MSIASILTVVGLQKIGTKISGPHNLIISSKPSAPGKISTIREEATQAGDEVTGEA
jgi:hypothetical protein